MEVVEESRCCREIPETSGKLKEGDVCLTELDLFTDMCLTEDCLRVSYNMLPHTEFPNRAINE